MQGRYIGKLGSRETDTDNGGEREGGMDKKKQGRDSKDGSHRRSQKKRNRVCKTMGATARRQESGMRYISYHQLCKDIVHSNT